jgi:hypothetical protein
MEERLEKDNLQTLIIESDQLVWEEEGKELMIEGTLFDVKEIKQLENGKIEIIGLFDQQETEIKKLASDIAASSSSTETTAKLSAQLFSITFYFQPTVLPVFISPDVYSSAYQVRKPDYLIDTYLSIHCPPPKA